MKIKKHTSPFRDKVVEKIKAGPQVLDTAVSAVQSMNMKSVAQLKIY